MTTYEKAYRKGVFDMAMLLPMEVPTAVNNADEFRGYFDGYGGHKRNPPEKRDKILEANLGIINFIT